MRLTRSTTMRDLVEEAALPAAYLAQQRRIPAGAWIEPSPRWLRVYFGGLKLADTRRAQLVFEPRRPLTYWLPMEDVRLEYLTAEPRARGSHLLYWTLHVGDRLATRAARSEPDPPPERAALNDHIAFAWHMMDSWVEEDEEAFAGPMSPYHRVDVRRSSRHIRVAIAGQTVAESAHPMVLFETGMPTRYYLPKQDVRMDLLVPTETTTSCPYKGGARYWSAKLGGELVRDIAWEYPTPLVDCSKIASMLSFYNEKVDIEVDGQREPRPMTKWS